MDFKNWILYFSTKDEQKCIPALFAFVLQQFIEIFGAKSMKCEECIVYNDPNAPYPMLITNRSPINIRTCSTLSSTSWGWAQYIYQISHELTHYIIRQYKEDKELHVRWFEETLCEAMSLYILRVSSQRWNKCNLSAIKPHYDEVFIEYFNNVYSKTSPSALQECHSFEELKNIENICEEQRISRSTERNFLADTFCEHPENISAFVWYTRYMRGDLLIDFKKWKEDDPNPLISKLESIQPNLES